ncbi:MAG: glycoside hydrolase family 3 N-terminal domain-containing protein [Candidatus Hadarchaeum sp.]|uniref:beta-glucosidase family protein n=1 Tax=Candidatus Hadarchaeum sp. TaxID=2883567 RepID=UPI003174F742
MFENLAEATPDVEVLLKSMSIPEKVAQLGAVWSHELVTPDGAVDYEKARLLLKEGIGHVTRPGSATGLPPKKVSFVIAAIQAFLRKETRLGIPAIFHEECLAGYPGVGGISFPQPIALASSWNPRLIENVAQSIGKQLLLLGIHQALAPVLDIARDPRWGRIEETFGEDPYLVSIMGVHYVKGLQGNGVVATGKHFVAYGLPEGGRNAAPVHIGERELKEVFMYPFQYAVKKAGLLSIMPAYHEIDGIPCTSNKKILNMLKTWGFHGTVVSDYHAIEYLLTKHKIVTDKLDAAKMAIEAGVDIELPAQSCYSSSLVDAINRGIVSESVVDEAVKRVLLTKIWLKIDQKLTTAFDEALWVQTTTEAQRLACQAALESITLLKNDGSLPIAHDKRRIVVFSNIGDDLRCWFGDYSFVAIAERMCLLGQKFENLRAIAYADMHAKGDLQAKFVNALGPNARLLPWNIKPDVFKKAVSTADVAIVIMGERSGFTTECSCGETRDSAQLCLMSEEDEKRFLLLRKMCRVPIILVLVVGRPYPIPEKVLNKVNALLVCWKPGEMGPEALAQILLGDFNPCGKLPVTIPRAPGQIPLYYYSKPTAAGSYWWKDYVDLPANPLYPFGFGLSYTRFSLTNVHLATKSSVSCKDMLEVVARVENIGDIDGYETVQVYVNSEGVGVTRPEKRLVGFHRLYLRPHECRTIRFLVPVSLLAFYNEDLRKVIKPGRHVLFVGNSSDNLYEAGEVVIRALEECEAVEFGEAIVE